VDDNIDQRESRLTKPIWSHCQISKVDEKHPGKVVS
jgi:hypothetical protein